MADETPAAPEMPEDPREAEARERALKLAKTMEVYERYDWGPDLVVIDPDDLLVDRPDAEVDPGQAPHPRLMRQDFDRLVDETYVGRVLDRAEELLADETALDLRAELNDALDEIENLTIPPHFVGFNVAAVADAGRRARAAREKREETEIVTDEARAAVEALVAAGEAGFEECVGAVTALGDAAWPALEQAAAADPAGPATTAALRAAERLGGARAVRLAVSALERDAENTADAALSCLRAQGEISAWGALGRLHFENLSPRARRVLLEVALDSDEPLAVTLVIHESIEAFQGELEGVSADHGEELARMLVQRGDRRAVPLLAFVLKSDRLAKDAHDRLVRTLQEHGLWGEVSRVLASFKGNWPLVVPAGNTFESFAARIAELEGVDVKDAEARDAFVQKAEAHWDECYREELGYQRTRDADRPGPLEAKLMGQFTAEASHLVQGVTDQQRIQARIENFRESWMRTPLPRLDGKPPLAAILEERVAMQPEGIGRVRARRSLLARTMQDVKALLDAERPKRARSAMTVLDALDPEYPPARRIRKRLQQP